MTLRDLTGNPEIERHEIEDAAHFDGLPDCDESQVTPDDSDADFVWRMEQQARDEADFAADDQRQADLIPDVSIRRYPFIVELSDEELCELLVNPYKVPGVLVRQFLLEGMTEFLRRMKRMMGAA